MSMLTGTQRRQELLSRMRHSSTPLSGTALARDFGVSRQVIVQDVALLRAEGHDILSTNRGYLCQTSTGATRVIPVLHSDEDIAEELNTVVDFGGTVVDVFVVHTVYGELRADLDLSSRKQVQDFVSDIRRGRASPLKNLTSGYHCHTIRADSEETLDLIEAELARRGFLAGPEEGPQ